MDSIRPLDLIAFRGASTLSNTIRIAEYLTGNDCTWNHVGLIVTASILPWVSNLKEDCLYILESTISNKSSPDMKTGKPYLGVQIRELQTIVDAYNVDRVSGHDVQIGCFRLIANPMDNTSIVNITKSMKIIYKKYIGVRYNCCPISLIAALIPCCRRCRRAIDKHYDVNWLFCSELVASVYADLGILPSTVIPANCLPGDLIGFDLDDYTKIEGGIPPLLFHPVIILTQNRM